MTAARTTLAMRVFLLLHDSFTGRCAVSPSALRCALVGAELAELILGGRVALERELVVIGEIPLAPGADQLSAFVVDSIARRTGTHGVPVWLAALGDAAADLVASSLVEAGILVRSRGLLGRTPLYPAADLLAAAGPRVRLDHQVRQPGEADLPTAFCASLLVAVGARRTINADGDRADTRRGLATLAKLLPDDLRAVVISVEVAHASGSLPPSLRLHPER